MDHVYNYTFFSSGIVQINNSFLQPARQILAGFLSDRTLAGLFADGLHIGQHIIPYPVAYIRVIASLSITLADAPPGLAGLAPP
jgi:hypothetical protein